MIFEFSSKSELSHYLNKHVKDLKKYIKTCKEERTRFYVIDNGEFIEYSELSKIMENY